MPDGGWETPAASSIRTHASVSTSSCIRRMTEPSAYIETRGLLRAIESPLPRAERPSEVSMMFIRRSQSSNYALCIRRFSHDEKSRMQSADGGNCCREFPTTQEHDPDAVVAIPASDPCYWMRPLLIA